MRLSAARFIRSILLIAITVYSIQGLAGNYPVGSGVVYDSIQNPANPDSCKNDSGFSQNGHCDITSMTDPVTVSQAYADKALPTGRWWSSLYVHKSKAEDRKSVV